MENNNIIHCYVINLEWEREKRERMKRRLANDFSNVEFIKAVNGKELSAEVISSVYDKSKTLMNIGRELTLGEIGCAISHLRIMENVVANNQIALILEDDIELMINEAVLKELLGNFPDDWECMLLGHHSKYSRFEEGIKSKWYKKTLVNDISCFRFCERPAGGYGYMINKAGAKKVLSSFKSITKPIDSWSDKVVNLYGISPALIHVVNLDNSNLDKERNELNLIKKDRCLSIREALKVGLKMTGINHVVHIILKQLNKIKILHAYK